MRLLGKLIYLRHAVSEVRLCPIKDMYLNLAYGSTAISSFKTAAFGLSI